MASNQLQEKFEEANRVLSGKFSSREDMSINIDKEMGLIEEQQGANFSMMVKSVGKSVEGDINTCPISDERGGIDEMGEVDDLVNLINEKLVEVHPSLSSEFCIYRIPQKIRELNRKAYDPRVISIGPFHHGEVRFKSMEAFKKRYLKKVVQRCTGVPLKKYVQFLKAQETSVRQSYSEIIEMGSDEFLTMLLLDSCFIIELLLCFYYRTFRDVDFSILTAGNLWGDICRDLMLLENQIPFFVLEGLFNLAMTGFASIPLLSLAIIFFQGYNSQNISHDDINSIKHFTDLLLIYHRPTPPRIVATKEFQSTKTATELDEAGIKLKMSSSKCLLDIKFSDGVLEIPCIQLKDKTECLVRNLMALELCNYPDNSYMIDYLFFMDYLVNTPKDVDLLVQSGIIDNWLGDSKQVADLINNMNVNITITSKNFYFSSLCKELNAYCKIPRHKWRAALKREYFSSPWRSASTSAAIFLLVLTLIQTICSLLSAASL